MLTVSLSGGGDGGGGGGSGSGVSGRHRGVRVVSFGFE